MQAGRGARRTRRDPAAGPRGYGGRGSGASRGEIGAAGRGRRCSMHGRMLGGAVQMPGRQRHDGGRPAGRRDIPPARIRAPRRGRFTAACSARIDRPPARPAAAMPGGKAQAAGRAACPRGAACQNLHTAGLNLSIVQRRRCTGHEPLIYAARRPSRADGQARCLGSGLPCTSQAVRPSSSATY